MARAARQGRDTAGSLLYATSGALPWLIWVVLLLVMRRFGGGRYHPPVSDGELSRGRRILCWAVLIVFLLIFTPVPMREGL